MLSSFPWPSLPVVGIELYRNDAVVIRSPGNAQSVETTRTEIKEFSKASRHRLAFVAANTDIDFTSLITLTYPRAFPNDGKDVKRNLNTFLVALRRKVKTLEYLWFLEFQKRGAPHIHILVRGMRVHRATQNWLSETWYKICATGDILHLRAGTRLELIRKPDGARHYAVKYAHKTYQKKVPKRYRNVGRFWGHSKAVKPVVQSIHRCTNDDLVGVLDAVGWTWQRGDTVRWKTLYGASVPLTLWLEGDILELSSSGQTETSHNRKER